MKYPSYLSLLLIATNALAAPATWYEVEVLAFERLVSNTEILEPGYSDLRQLNLNKRLRLPSPNIKTLAEESMDLRPLPPQAWKLTSIEQRLNNSSLYRRLLHQAWSQPAATPRHAQPIYLRLSPIKAFSRRKKTVSENPIVLPLHREAPFPSEFLSSQLEGTVTLSHKSFLQISLDLLYRQSLKALAPSELRENSSQAKPFSKYFRLVESRRVQVRELHYFDHPLFGILIQVRQSTAPNAGNLTIPQTFPMETTAIQEIPSNQTSKEIKPTE